MSVSRWERGVQDPSSQIFVKLGLLANDELRWEFWERAGLSREHVVATAASGNAPLSSEREMVGIPLLDARLGASLVSDFITGATAIEILAAPASWCPNPDATYCAFVEGSSMEPHIREGSIACFDSSERSPSAVAGQVVVAQHPRLGTKLAWLRQEGDGFVFRSEDPSIPPTPLDEQWKIIGRLLWWMTRA